MTTPPDTPKPPAEFCRHCGAGIGKFRRYGEGTCHRCDLPSPQGAHKLAEELAPLRRFVGWLLEDYQEYERGGIEIDGFEAQNVLTACGLLTKVVRTETCGDDCSCAEYLGATDSEEWDCYEMTPLAMKLREEYRAIAASGGAQGDGNG